MMLIGLILLFYTWELEQSEKKSQKEKAILIKIGVLFTLYVILLIKNIFL